MVGFRFFIAIIFARQYTGRSRETSMNIRAACSNPECSACGIEKSVMVGQMLGYGVENDRVKCPSCGELMKTTETINTSSKGRSKTIPRRKDYRKRTSKRY
jgi:hypothetical protein